MNGTIECNRFFKLLNVKELCKTAENITKVETGKGNDVFTKQLLNDALLRFPKH